MLACRDHARDRFVAQIVDPMARQSRRIDGGKQDEHTRSGEHVEQSSTLRRIWSACAPSFNQCLDVFAAALGRLDDLNEGGP